MTTLFIKNMVCDRCKMAVEVVLKAMRLTPVSVELGVAMVQENMDVDGRRELTERLRQLGFELLDDQRQQKIERIKTMIIRLIRTGKVVPAVNLSDYLAEGLHAEYSQLSKLFSEVVGMTIERYFILQRIEFAKELICYDELSLKQIALRLNYSSTAHLSAQFKSVTGMTPSQFKGVNRRQRTELDKI